MSYYPPERPYPPQREIRNVRRLGFLMLVLTGLLVVVLGLYSWPIVAGWFTNAGGQPRVVTPRGDLMQVETTTIKLFKSASPSVAFITTEGFRRNPFSRRVVEVPQGSGSGFIWDEQGHVVTNFHVINGASRAHVILNDQTSYDAQVVGVSEDHDLAVLKISPGLGVHLTPLPIGTSGDLEVGQSVFAIGNPFGLDQTLTTGIISALNRQISGESGLPIDGVIQTDAAINPGNSGGPLLDSSGRLIGVNTAIYSPSGQWSGIGFAIPVDMANRVIPEIIAHGHYSRARLGISIPPEAQSLIDPRKVRGVVVAGVQDGSPASNAGMKGIVATADGSFTLGDVITQINDHLIKSREDLFSAMDKVRPGEAVRVKVWNDGATRELMIKVAE